MSYTFGQEGGTTYGLVSWNDLFAPNTTIPWDDLLQDLDTVICRIPYTIVNNDGEYNLVAHRLLTNYKIYGKNHWLGDGITVALNNETTHSFLPGEPCLISEDAASSGSGFANVRACFKRPTTSPTGSGNREPLGIVLEQCPAYDDETAAQSYSSVLVTGICPAFRQTGSDAPDYGEPIFFGRQNIGTPSVSRGAVLTDGNAEGQCGRVLSTNTTMYIDSSGTQASGATVLLLNKSEVY